MQFWIGISVPGIKTKWQIRNIFLFVVSEVSTGRRCLSLALFFQQLQKSKTFFTVNKPIKNRLVFSKTVLFQVSGSEMSFNSPSFITPKQLV